MRKVIAFLLLLPFLLAACQPAAPTAPPATPTNPLTAATPTLAAVPPVLADALTDLSASLNLQPGDLELLGYQETTWQDSCLGLPRAGENCVQALTPGYSASLVTAQGEVLELRVDLTGRTARHVPGAALAARRDLALRTALLPEDSVRFLSIETVQWSDACLALPLAGEVCAEVITPGYRVTMEADGRQVVFHTDRAGATIRSEAGEQALLPEVQLKWRSTGDIDCREASFGEPGALFGPCDGGKTLSPFLSPTRLADLQEFTVAFAPFKAQTPAGEVELFGSGSAAASRAQQRMVAEWARLAAIEAEIGRGEQDWGLALRMDRSGGLPDYCDAVSVSVTGEVVVSDCSSGSPPKTNRYRLDTPGLEKVYGWVDSMRPFNETLTGPPYTVALIVHLYLNAVGNSEMTQAEIQAMVDFCSELIDSIPQPE